MQERQKLSAMGLLVSGVAHDRNTPLSGISGFAQLLLRGESDEHKRQDLQHILAEVERCRHIAGELLSLARRHPPERRPVSVPTIVRRTLALRERFLHAGGISVRMDAAETLPEIVADGHQLQQVFLNLLLNAEQAVGSQGSRIDIRIAPGEGSGEDLGWLVVEFFNDGPPIPEEILPHIFEPFVTTKGEEEGTGLGLTICNRIVREHRGRIEVDSGTEGTRFRILLPTDGLDASPASV
jgi:two-component system, NtrC family, sensor kinase